MKFPDKLKIFYKEYDIKYIDGNVKLGDNIVNGKVDYNKKQIEISTVDNGEVEILEILLHEILHIISSEMGIIEIIKNEHEEEMIDSLVIGLVDIILRNKL